MRRALFLAICLFTTPSIAAGVLPFDGIYGNESGCHLYATGDRGAGDYLLLTPDTFSSAALGCDFGALVSSDGVVFIVDAVCSPGGKSTVRISDFRSKGFALSVDNRNGLWRDLMPCPAEDLTLPEAHA